MRIEPGQFAIVMFLGLCFLPSIPCRAQCPTSDAFDPRADDLVTSLAVQADGRIILGGRFTTLAGQQHSYVARLNSDGTLDNAFNPSIDGNVYAVALQQDGKIFVGGSFTTLDGKPHQHVGWIDADGGTDDSFYALAASAASISCLALLGDGRIVVGGAFGVLGGHAYNSIGVLGSDGYSDSSFGQPGAGGSSPVVHCVALQPDGKILVGGRFTSLGRQSRTNIGRVDIYGLADSSFNPGADYDVESLAVQADGKIIVGGSFTKIAGQSRGNLARLNLDGTLDSTFNPQADNVVLAIAIQANGKILVGGEFTSLGGQPRNSIGRLNADGTLDSTFDIGDGFFVNIIAVQTDGKILVAGGFNALGGQLRGHIGRLCNNDPATQTLDYDGTAITWLRGGSSPEIYGATFDYTTDGLTWDRLGVGTRTNGGWQLRGVSLPSTGTLRARGRVLGSCNGSGWFAERYRGKPALLSPIRGTTNVAGTTASLYVAVGEGEPVTLQWMKDGVALTDGPNTAGAATSTLALSQVFGSDEGGYSVMLSNAFGSVTSSVATLTVLDPFFTQNPMSTNREAGDEVSFDVSAVGSPPLSYQWYHNGTAVPGAVNPSLTLQGLLKADSGLYTAVVTNVHASVTSSVANLIVYDPVIKEPFLYTYTNGIPGGSVTFDVTVAGTPPLRYQWYHDGIAIAGAVDCKRQVNHL